MQNRQTAGFDSIRIKGGMLPTDIVHRIRDLDTSLPGTAASTYHVEKGDRLEEQINRTWKVAREAWQNFRPDLERLLETGERGTTETREKWLLPLFETLGYGRLLTRTAAEIDGKPYPISHGWHHVPIHLLGCTTDLDQTRTGVAGAARSNPHAMVQEYLNRSQEYLWGFLSNGRRLRVLRDNASLVRQAFIDFDLEAMMEGGLYADFRVLWLLLHQSRVEHDVPVQCWLEVWAQSAITEGARALDALRNGVEKAIEALGSGFLDANPTLRDRVVNDPVSPDDLFRQLLRMAYRFIFLFVAEDRDLLLHPSADDAARRRYAEYYSTARLRDLAARLRGTRHPDLMRGLWVVFEALGSETGQPRLGLPALGSLLWSDDAIPDLLGLDISNRDLLSAIRHLALVETDGKLRPVDYRNMGAEELGSVYESLLELVPRIEGGHLRLQTLAGSERKTTGSYYTRQDLVDQLLETALDPLIDRASGATDPAEALLALRICDPACGSGHFLIAAAHRVANRLASVRSGDEQPGERDVNEALRDVIAHCIYGVDLNEMAVELCTINLWLESLEPGKPLSFLDHHIQCGNSLLGATPALIASGIPDDAFDAVTLDDNATVKALKRRNKAARTSSKGQLGLFVTSADTPLSDVLYQIESLPERTVAEVEEKRRRHEAALESEAYRNQRLVADAWCAAFLVKKGPSLPELTQEELRSIQAQPDRVRSDLRDAVEGVASQYRLFHWHLAFPEVFGPTKGDGGKTGHGWDGGFDLVAGNPPWERVKLQEKEWFAPRRPDIAEASNKAARGHLIEALKSEDPPLYDAFQEAKREAEAVSRFFRVSGCYPLCGRGDVNLYTVFAELFRHLIGGKGRVGMVVPSGIASDDTTKYFFQDLMDSATLASLYDFENRKALFPGVHRSYKFSLVTLSGVDDPQESGADFVFFAHEVADLGEEDRHFTLSADDIALLNPNTRTCPIFRSKRDAELTKSIYRRVPVLVKEAQDGQPEENPWGAYYIRLVDFGDHSSQLKRNHAATRLPVLESKFVNAFDHRYATWSNADRPEIVTEADKQSPTFEVSPRYWVESEFFEALMSKYPDYDLRWFLGYRDVARSTDERTVIGSALPRGPASRKLPVLGFESEKCGLCLLANLNSFVLDYVARQMVGGISMAYHVVKQLPIIPPSEYSRKPPFCERSSFADWIEDRVKELVATDNQMAAAVGKQGPSIWDDRRRLLLRAEIDAAFLLLYGVEMREAEYILSTFPIVRRHDEAQFGDYRTKKMILSIYDKMTEAIETGVPYESPLDPPPGEA